MTSTDFPTTEGSALDALCINTLRFLSIDAVQKAASGHPGLPLGAAPMAYALWMRHLKHHPANPAWLDRDRFILSAGHGSMLLYSLLHLTGYDLPLDQIVRFRQSGSLTPGHPERGLTPGVETTTGPLGQGLANAVGMAMAETRLAACYNRPGFEIVDHHTYALVSDGDLMEGVAAEAASLAGHLRLGKLICLYDDNRVTLSAGTAITFTEDRAQRFDAYGWHTETVDDGNDLAAIDAALLAARAEQRRPSLILVRTHLGYGSPNRQDTYQAHGSPLGNAEVRLTKHNLGWPPDPAFHIPAPALAHFRRALAEGQIREAHWNTLFAAYARVFPELAEMLLSSVRGALPDSWDRDIPVFPADPKGMATRVASGKVLNALAPRVPSLIGGSADLNPSTFTALTGHGDFEAAGMNALDRQGSDGGGWSRSGRNLHFGVREHAMGAILNGLAAHGGILPFGATFLIFSDYMRPPIRLAALMRLQVIYVFTHDSLAVGEDGATHQPIEQLAGLRAVPGLLVIRPADANETAVAWRVALEARERPTALILTRQDVPTIDRLRFAPAEGLRRGGYVLADAPDGRPALILIATGSEVGLALAAHAELLARGVAVRVVSLPCWRLFDAQPQSYQDAVLPKSVGARLAIEAGVSQGWHRYVGDRGDVLGIAGFGASAPGAELMRDFGFTVENVCDRALKLLV
ncbi:MULTISPECIES: transketolase [Burkholderia]|uniref:Transketolase n=1 Tax=Burkholderia orbicola (strain MC0-3) TaxID=406425 RepID=B1K1L9_BURO0|nr:MULTISPECIES: transketolase [Burkholderia]ACA90869.1 transketolase [Burkholderia orbicola MC0-3]MCA8088295.1 transketolase [Burkholderia cenocepacia]OXI79965.1 transketolase [Burkholderia sp. AU33423]VWB19597.1 transketolase [Burkholderia metallica]HEB3531525.1 transketolase [Burkholderia cenocepacia]